MEFKQPDGEDEANVEDMTRDMDTIVMYHLRAADQFFGFSMSPSEKSRCPELLRCIDSLGLTFLLRYGFAAGRESVRSRNSIVVVDAASPECYVWEEMIVLNEDIFLCL